MEADPPLAAPPPGVKSNYVDPPTLAPAIIACSAACVGVMLPCVVLRLYVKRRVVGMFWWDDCKHCFSILRYSRPCPICVQK